MTNKAIIFLLVSTLVLAMNVRASERSATGPDVTHWLMPVPASIRFEAGRLALTSAFQIGANTSADARLMAAIDRIARRIERRTALTLSRDLSGEPSRAGLFIESGGPGMAVPSLDEDESYSLVIEPTQARLKAPTTVGALRGLETLIQLLSSDREGYFFPAVTIEDRPRFRWRGLLIDACRHFQPVDVIKRNLDGMAAVKLNVLHWHLTEDQGFRVESKRYPKLHQLGSDGLFYTQDQIRDVVAYARDRGIRVVPEFDMPGHATAWLVGHPELASQPGPYQIERRWGIFDPSFDPTNDKVYKLLDGFLGEMAALFPDSYMHIGGDENNGNHWNKSAKIQEFMKKKRIEDNHALQNYFNQHLLAILKKHGKKMVGWDEILHPDLPRDIVVQSWRGQQSLAEGAKKGYYGILSNGYYLDYMSPASEHYLVDPIPAGTDLNADQAARILGGEACMWAEYVSPETIDSRIWPRMAAIAERLWSAASVNDVEDMYRRLSRISVQLEDLGLNHERNRAAMLRRLAGEAHVGPLEELAQIVEPVKVYNRGKEFPTTQLTPLTRLVDAARPESVHARRFRQTVDEFIADAPRFTAHRAEILGMLSRWRNIEPDFSQMAEGSPILREAEPLARGLSQAAVFGMAAMTHLADRKAPDAEWSKNALGVLADLSSPRAEVLVMVVPSLRLLVTAASDVEQLRTIKAETWVERVKANASR